MNDSIEQNLQTPKNAEIPDHLPLLPVRDIVVFPYMVLPLFVGRDMSIKAIEAALAGNQMILLATQKALDIENPTADDIHTVGTVGIIMRMLKLPDERIKVLVQGLSKAKITGYIQTEPYYSVRISKFTEQKSIGAALETEATMRTVKEQIEQLMSLGKVLIPEVMVVIENLEDPGRLADMVASNLGLKVEITQAVLEIIDPIKRLRHVSDILGKEIEVLSMQQKIQAQAKGEMDKTQREYFLREQLKAIQKELGELDERAEEITEFRKRIAELKMPEKVLKETEKQLKRLEKMHPDTAESATVRTYIEWIVELPWSKRSKDNLNLKTASKVLNEDHYDLEKVKERILEYLAVRKLKDKMKGPILCFVGPPGTGKTSLGEAIAESLGRAFYRISVGGVRDEAEIRGHRRTYVGSLPGLLIQAMRRVQVSDPVLMIDEIDKMAGGGAGGDPTAAMLEVLDPAQNATFTDHYLNLPFDLSSALFICTANNLFDIPHALRDRLEVIRIAGYTVEEKVEIAWRYLLPRLFDSHGITDRDLQFTDEVLSLIADRYAREAGLRTFERQLAALMRRRAKRKAEGEAGAWVLDAERVEEVLGPPRWAPEAAEQEPEIGTVTGLAWTANGGELMTIEALRMPGTGKLIVTGHLGDVMRESVDAASSYVRSRARQLRVADPEMRASDLHVHFPAGSVPKDGPSAGVAVTLAIASVMSRRPVRRDVAVTGEVTLRGKVLEIGGVKEKVLAAYRAGLRTVVLPAANKKDLRELPEEVRGALHVHFAATMDEVVEVMLLPARPNAMAEDLPLFDDVASTIADAPPAP